MEKELDPDVIKSTQISLGRYVKRPPLSEKLLRKPPFRFLHDIVTTVLKTTGFFKNLFDEEELISDNVKDRDSKITFLNKVIFVLSSTTGKSLSAKPSKIVAGQEPEKTNELLQCLAQALDEKLSSNEAVKKYKESTKSDQVADTKSKEPNKPTRKANNDAKKLTSRSSDKINSQTNDVSRSITKQDKEKTNDVKSKRKENVSVKPEPRDIKKTQSKTPNKKNTKDQKSSPKEESTQSRHKSNSSNNVEIEKVHNTINNVYNQESDIFVDKEEQLFDSKQDDIENQAISPRMDEDVDDKHNSSYTIAENDLNTSPSLNDLMESTPIDQITESKEHKIQKETTLIDVDHPAQTIIEVNDNVRPKNLDSDVNIRDKIINLDSTIVHNENVYKTVSVDKPDPLTVVKSPSKTGKHDSKNCRPPSVRPSSSRPGAPRMREKLDNVIKDTDNLLLGKVNIIIENTQNDEDEETSLVIMDQQLEVSSPLEHQELQLSSNEHGHLVQQILDSQKELSQISGKTEIEWQFGAQKAREANNQEIEQLRFNIQALSRVANPLGKLLDHIQEDVEVMRQELLQWSNIYEDVTKEMLKQKTLNEDSLTPFHTKLNQLEQDIEEKHDKINDLKILVHKNAFRIEKLLASGNVQ